VRIPTLRAVLDLLQPSGCLVNIEIKNFPAYYPGLADKVVETVRAAGMSTRVLLSCFDHEVLGHLAQIAPEMRTAALTEDPIHPLLPYLQGLHVVAFHPSKEVLGADSVAFHREKRLRTDLIETLAQAGIGVNVWTVNDPDLMRAFVAAGVNGICTDFPQTLRLLLDAPR